jgi:peptidoglycan/LPS O-acetylase OafA/YrhL
LRFDALAFGCLLRFCEPAIRQWQSSWKLFPTMCVGGALMIYFIFLSDFSYATWFHASLAYLSAGLLLCAGIAGFRPFERLGKIKPLLLVGRCSYGIYLWHYVLIYPILILADTSYVQGGVILSYFVLSIALGVLTTKTLERYFLNLRNQWIP